MLLRIGIILTAVFILAPVQSYADFAKGVTAYDTKDYKTAFQEWEKAAENGDLAAQRNLGHLYRWGKGVERNSARAAYWYHRAAKVGFDRAQYNLAILYFRGEGVPKDEVEAMRWLEKSAKQGNKHANIMLEKMQKNVAIVPSTPSTPSKSSVAKKEENKTIPLTETKLAVLPKPQKNILETKEKTPANELMAHIGSYGVHKNTELGWNFLKEHYKNHHLFTKKITLINTPKKGTIYRLHAVGTASNVKKLCTEFKKNKHYCIIYNKKGHRVH